MSYSEQVLGVIVEMSQDLGVNLFEATAMYCEDNDIDPSELMESLDSLAIEQIKFAAIQNNHVRRCIQGPINALL